MIEPKPLSKDRAKEIREHFWQFQAILQSQSSDQVMQEMSVSLITHMPGDFMDLLSAETFWRDAVKKAKVHRQVCAWCGWTGINDHEPDCPWLLAQDGDSK